MPNLIKKSWTVSTLDVQLTIFRKLVPSVHPSFKQFDGLFLDSITISSSYTQQQVIFDNIRIF